MQHGTDQGVSVALPALQTALHASVKEIQWVVEAYALQLTALLLGVRLAIFMGAAGFSSPV
jgi:hypothetical protein